MDPILLGRGRFAGVTSGRGGEAGSRENPAGGRKRERERDIEMIETERQRDRNRDGETERQRQNETEIDLERVSERTAQPLPAVRDQV